MNEKSTMQAYLQVLGGRSAGKKIWLEQDIRLRVGQSARADVVLLDDTMAPLHFDVAWNGRTCTLSSIGGHEFVCNGQVVDQNIVADHGSVVMAGQTSFFLSILSSDLRAHLPPASLDVRPSTEPLLAARRHALLELQGQPHLFALLDAARDRRIRALLEVTRDTHESLFDGPKAQPLADVAPYLVELSPTSPLLEVLVNEGWGNSWGVYLVGVRPFKEIRRRLRRLLMVKDEQTNKRLYFRFYDPRVLREFWPAASTRQRSEMLGDEIQSFILEGSRDEIVRL